MALETKDLELLTRPFPAEAHKFINGLAYLHEEPLNERLDMVDPSWSFVIKSISSRPNAGEGGKDMGTVTVHASLIIKDVSRDSVGMAVIQKTKSGESEANEAEKSATTDALKRCARMFGLGRYLLTMPKDSYGKVTIVNVEQLRHWLKNTYGDIKASVVYHDTSPDPLDPDTHLGEVDNSPDVKWLEVVKKYTISFYNNVEKHQNASLDKAYNDGLIKPSMSAEAAASIMLAHRVEVNYRLSPEESKSLIQSALAGTLGDYLRLHKKDFAAAWRDIQTHVNMTKDEIPF